MNKQVVVVDADAIIAQVNADDAHHLMAMRIAKKLNELEAEILYPASAIVESVTHVQRVLNDSGKADEIITVAMGSNFRVIEVNKLVLKLASHYFDPKSTKKNTLFDCVVAAIAKEYDADAIFSFDKFYKKQGFKLASEL